MALKVFFLDDEPRAFWNLRKRTAPHAEYSSAQNNLDLDLDNYDVFDLLATAAFDLTGIVAPSSGQRRIILRNVGTATITLKNASGSSTAANRFLDTRATPADYTLAAGDFVVLVYDAASARWLVGQKMNRTGFKKELPAEGAIIVLNGKEWNFEHLSTNKAGAASTGDIFYRKGLSAPSADYGDDDAATDEATQILASGEVKCDRVQADTEGHAMYFVPSAAVDIEFWPNEGR